MIIYNYNPSTGEYIGTGEAKESPREPGVFLIPANAVTTVPPTVKTNEIACWNGTKWEKKADFRGKIYYDKTTKEKHEIKEIGIAPNVNWTDVEPADPDAEWNGSAWEVPFSVFKARKLMEIKQAYNSHVAGSFICSLGYPMQFNETDGVKMEGAIKLLVANGGTSGYLTDANDETHYDVPLADIQAVHLEMLAKYAEAHAKKQVLRQQVKAATTQAELDAIQW